MKPGIFIKSTSLLDDTIFEKSLIFIVEYNEKGAMGFIVNNEFPRKLNELEEFKHIIPFPIHLGGPVDQEHLYFVHQRPDLIEEGVQVADNIFLGGDFKSVVKNIDNNTLTEKDIKIFIGYCGWDYHELDEEITEGSWRILEDGALF
jgi:putative transcriptional regulator